MCIVRLQLNRIAPVRQCFHRPPLRIQRIAQAVVRLSVIRVDLDRAPPFGRSARRVPALAQNLPQIVVGRRISGIGFDRLAQFDERLVQPPQLLERSAREQAEKSEGRCSVSVRYCL